MEFTTEQRRKFTSNILTQQTAIKERKMADMHLQTTAADRINEDRTNRELFRTINAEITGLSYEYMCITGKRHKMLEETEFVYTEAVQDEGSPTFTNYTKTYMDSQLLHDAATLETSSEFYPMAPFPTVETFDIKYPNIPEWLSSWQPDTSIHVTNESVYESTLFSQIQDSINVFNKETLDNLLNTLKNIFINQVYYLNTNPNKNNSDNLPILNGLNQCITEINTSKKENSSDYSSLLLLIKGIREPIYTNRINYIINYLSNATELYSNMAKIIKKRLAIAGGTLRDVEKAKKILLIADEMAADKEDTIEFYKNYFTVFAAERDGQSKRRLFVVDPNGELKEGDWVYVLSDNEKIKEVYGQIELIVDGRLVDQSTYKINKNSNIPELVRYNVKKLFFKRPINFTGVYKKDDKLRVIKQKE